MRCYATDKQYPSTFRHLKVCTEKLLTFCKYIFLDDDLTYVEMT